MKSRLLFVLGSLLCLSLPAAAEAPVVVNKLRLPRVVMFDAPRGTPIGEIQKTDYVAGAWTVAGQPDEGFIRLSGNGKIFYVKTGAIDTDKRIASSAECGVKIAGKVEKIGATRALGEECK